MRILLIEADEHERKILKKQIEKKYLDIKVYDVANIKQGKKYVEEKDINLFIIDTVSTDQKELKFAQELRNTSKYRLTEIVFLTKELVKEGDELKKIKGCKYLKKPYTMEDIQNIIDSLYKGEEKEKENNKDEAYFLVGLPSGITKKIYEDDIVFVEYAQRKCTIYTEDDVFESKTLTLTKILNDSRSGELVQSHKSYIINTKYIDKIVKVYSKIWDIHFTVLDEVAQLSNSYKNLVFERWQKV